MCLLVILVSSCPVQCPPHPKNNEVRAVDVHTLMNFVGNGLGACTDSVFGALRLATKRLLAQSPLPAL